MLILSRVTWTTAGKTIIARYLQTWLCEITRFGICAVMDFYILVHICLYVNVGESAAMMRSFLKDGNACNCPLKSHHYGSQHYICNNLGKQAIERIAQLLTHDPNSVIAKFTETALKVSVDYVEDTCEDLCVVCNSDIQEGRDPWLFFADDSRLNSTPQTPRDSAYIGRGGALRVDAATTRLKSQTTRSSSLPPSKLCQVIGTTAKDKSSLWQATDTIAKDVAKSSGCQGRCKHIFKDENFLYASADGLFTQCARYQ